MAPKREELDLQTADGVSHGVIFGDAGGPRPGILLYTDAFGVRPSMQEMAERLARLGHLVLLPNLFYRAGDYPPFDVRTAFSDPPERDRLMTLIRALTPERIGADADAYLGALAASPGVRRDRVAVVGYCMGGRLAYLTAALHPDRVRAAASFHGGGLVTDAPDSPHRLADRIRGAVYLAVADQDRGCTPEHQGALAAALGAADVAYAIELYRGKRHGFAVSDHPGAHDPDAEARHWRRLEAFFGEALAAG